MSRSNKMLGQLMAKLRIRRQKNKLPRRSTAPDIAEKVCIEQLEPRILLNGDLHVLDDTVDQGAEIHGINWNDLNRDGERNADDPGLADVMIYADLNFNGHLDEGEPRGRTMTDDSNTVRNELDRYWMDLTQGTHVIREIVPPGFVQTFPEFPIPSPEGTLPPDPFGAHIVTLEAGDVLEKIEFGNHMVSGGQVHGLKWNDVDKNGQRNQNELGLAGVTIFSDRNLNGILDEGEPHTVTMSDDPQTSIDETGRYCLTDLRPGIYVIREVVPDGFVQTFPTSPLLADGENVETEFDLSLVAQGAHIVYLPPGGVVDGLDFGNHSVLGQIHGIKWRDEDRDGRFEPNAGERPLPDWMIYLDQNQNQRRDPNEQFHVTDELGRYSFMELESGIYHVAEVPQPGWHQTWPPPLARVSQVASQRRSDSGAFDFAIVDAGAGGNRETDQYVAELTFDVAWSTTCSSLVDDQAKHSIDGHVIQVDLFGQHTGQACVLVARPPQKHTIRIEGLEEGTYEIIGNLHEPIGSRNPQPTWQTFAVFTIKPNGQHRIKLDSWQIVDGVNFGNRPRNGSIHGLKWNDLNGDGQRGDNEPGKGGVTIYSDLNFNGRLDRGEPRTLTMRHDPSSNVDEAGIYWLEGLRPGVHLIREVVPDGFIQTFPDFPLIDPADLNPTIEPPDDLHGAHLVLLEPGSKVVDIDFGNQAVLGQIHGIKWLDEDGDGKFEPDAGEIPLPNWLIYLDLNNNRYLDPDERFEITNEHGRYWFKDLKPGIYHVGEVLKPGWQQTWPLSSAGTTGATHRIKLELGRVVEGVDFGNRPLDGSIHGFKWHDLDGDDNHDPDEPGLAGVTIYSDLNFNGRLDEGEPRAETMDNITKTDFDELGRYWLNGLRSGFHLVREVVPDGFVQTFPRYPQFDRDDPDLPFDPLRPVDWPHCYRETPLPKASLFANRWPLRETGPIHCYGVHLVHLQPGETVEGIDFGNQMILGAIHGLKWNDEDADGRFEPNAGETPIANWVIYLDQNNNRRRDPDERFEVTDERGAYWFTDLEPGLYTVAEVLRPRWEQTWPGPGVRLGDVHSERLANSGAFDFVAIDAGAGGKNSAREVVVEIAFEVAWSTVCSSLLQEMEHSVENGVIKVDLFGHTTGEASILRLGQPERRSLRIDALEPGSYEIVGTLQESFGDSDHFTPTWQTYAKLTVGDDGGHKIKIDRGQIVDGVDFGNRRLRSSIHGLKWNDINYNGQLDGDEPGLAGVKIYLDLNFNGRLDPGEPKTKTMRDDPATDFDETGLYWLDDLRPGFHFIREVVPQGFKQTFPDPRGVFHGGHAVVLRPGQAVDGIDFGNHQKNSGQIHGLKWIDINGDGQRDSDEPGLAGVKIYSDLNFNGRLDRGDTRTRTMEDDPATDLDETGLYWLENLRPGIHVVREVVPKDFVQTFPNQSAIVPWAHAVFLRKGEIVEGIDFSNQRIERGQIHGLKWHDLNGDGHRDPDEPGWANVKIYSDLNSNGRLNRGEPRTLTMEDDPETDFDETGLYWLEELRPGIHVIREIIPAGFVQTFPLSPLVGAEPIDGSVGPNDGFVIGAHVVRLEPGEVVDGIDFGNRKIGPGQIHGRKWNDLNTNAEHDPHEPGLPGVTIYSDLNHNGRLNEGEPHAVTMEDNPFTDFDEGGLYWLEDLRPGLHFIREIVPHGFVQTFPGLVPKDDFPDDGTDRPDILPYDTHIVVIESGDVVEGIDFGNHMVIGPGQIHGRKWNDLNGNGEQDGDEPGLAGVTIYSDLNRNGRLNKGEPHTITMEEDPFTDFDEGGLYWLEDLRPGLHLIREIVPHGFIQTFPRGPVDDFPDDGTDVPDILPHDAHFVVIESGDVVEGINFGNRRIRIIVDNRDTDFVPTGQWKESRAVDEHEDSSIFSKQAGDTARWSTTLTEAGTYRVHAMWSGLRPNGTPYERDPMARIEVVHADGITSRTVDQNLHAGGWYELGVFRFTDAGQVKLTSSGQGANGTSADAIWFEPLDVVPDTIVDNDRSEDGSFTTTGTWKVSSAIDQLNHSSLFSKQGGAKAHWMPDLPEPGIYQVLAWWTGRKPDGTRYARDPRARFTVNHMDGASQITIDQNSKAGRWVNLGTYGFAADGSAKITLTASGAGSNGTSANAVMLRPMPEPVHGVRQQMRQVDSRSKPRTGNHSNYQRSICEIG